MRLLELNRTKLWYVNKIGEVEVKDDNGHYTGELITEYSEPAIIELHLYPASGKVLQETFGLSANLDFITHSKIKLDENTLLFLEEPNNVEEYDLTIDNILPSLNIFHYGLKGVR